MQRDFLVCHGVDEEVVVRWEGGVAWEAEFVDVQVGRGGWEGAVGGGEDGVGMGVVFEGVGVRGGGVEVAVEGGWGWRSGMFAG